MMLNLSLSLNHLGSSSLSICEKNNSRLGNGSIHIPFRYSTQRLTPITFYLLRPYIQDIPAGVLYLTDGTISYVKRDQNCST